MRQNLHRPTAAIRLKHLNLFLRQVFNNGYFFERNRSSAIILARERTGGNESFLPCILKYWQELRTSPNCVSPDWLSQPRQILRRCKASASMAQGTAKIQAHEIIAAFPKPAPSFIATLASCLKYSSGRPLYRLPGSPTRPDRCLRVSPF